MKRLTKLRLFGGILAWLLINIYTAAQPVNKVLVSGLGGQHDIDVQTAFEMGYASYDGSIFSGTITRYYDGGITNSMNYASTNGYQVVVRSTVGLSSAISIAPSYPNIQIVMPAGSNSHDYVYDGDIETCPVIVTGAGDDYNETGYRVEFYAPDPITIEPDYSSFSNGYIAGQIAYLANSLDITMQEARIIARESIPGDNSPDLYDGYGKINVETVLAAALPVQLVSFNASKINNKVQLVWNTATEINNYGFEIERLISSNQSSSTIWNKIGFVTGNGNTNLPKNYSFIDSAPPSGKIQYRLKQVDFDGKYEYSYTVEINIDAPIQFLLKQNYPNPFNPTTVISFEIPTICKVQLKVYDILGNEVSSLVNEEKAPGKYDVKFDGSKLASGIYFYQLQSGNFTQLKKFVLLK